MFLNSRLRYVLCLSALVSPAVSFGQSRDAEQPVNVEADAAQLNEVSGIGIYRGDVRITHDSMVLTADKVTLIAPGRNLQKVIAESGNKSNKSTFRQITDTGDILTAKSRRIDYEPDINRITLLGDAVLRRSPDRFAAERIVYHIEAQVIDAGGRQGGGRVNMTLVPEDRGERAPGKE